MPAGASDAVRHRDQVSHFSVGRARANLRPGINAVEVRFVSWSNLFPEGGVSGCPVSGFDRGTFQIPTRDTSPPSPEATVSGYRL
jgi:hypothetical protein